VCRSRQVISPTTPSSLKPVLDSGIRSILDTRADQGGLVVGNQSVSTDEYLLKVLKNFWSAVAEVNPGAHREPQTTVLWGSIGAASCHAALARIIATALANENEPNLTKQRFTIMVEHSNVADYAFWFSRPGSQGKEYPGEKGEATQMTGAANYSRLARTLEQQWRSALHAVRRSAAAIA
jgi:hypothetical protein